MHTVSRGFAIDYTVSGDGPPLLLIPGTLCSARQWRDFGYAATLDERWRVIANPIPRAAPVTNTEPMRTPVVAPTPNLGVLLAGFVPFRR